MCYKQAKSSLLYTLAISDQYKVFNIYFTMQYVLDK